VKLRIKPSNVSGVVSAPPSKSYSHRALILGSLAQGETVIENFLASDDTLHTINACRSLGVNIQSAEKTVRIIGSDGRFSVQRGHETIFVGNSGSTIRMVAPLAALARTKVVFDGEARLCQRPISDLLSALESLGVQARSINKDGCPPIEVHGGKLLGGGEVAVSGMTSSQHISSLLMIAPYAKRNVKIKVVDGLHSKPYVDITIDAMRQFGVDVVDYNQEEFTVTSGQRYRGKHHEIEGDYSSAAYFFAMAAIGQKPITVGNLKASSVQGDRHLLDILSRMGCYVNYREGQVEVTRDKTLTALSLDMGNYPDVVLPLAIVAAFANGKTEITNIGHLRHKETDRINSAATELRKMEINVDVTESTMSITGGKPKGAVIETYNDHRMAMSFATAALFADGDTIINGAEAVTKSYPGFFTDLAQIGASIEEI
jgi:3-phosphoshikimate 1-carboxyvinyltransferase